MYFTIQFSYFGAEGDGLILSKRYEAFFWLMPATFPEALFYLSKPSAMAILPITSVDNFCPLL